MFQLDFLIFNVLIHDGRKISNFGLKLIFVFNFNNWIVLIVNVKVNISGCSQHLVGWFEGGLQR